MTAAAQAAGVWSSFADWDRARLAARARFEGARDRQREAGRWISPLVARITRPSQHAVDEWIIRRAQAMEARSDWLTSAEIAGGNHMAPVIPLPRRTPTATETVLRESALGYYVEGDR